MDTNYKTVAFTFLPELIEEVTEAAKADRRSRSAWVSIACEEKLERDAKALQERNHHHKTETLVK